MKRVNLFYPDMVSYYDDAFRASVFYGDLAIGFTVNTNVNLKKKDYYVTNYGEEAIRELAEESEFMSIGPETSLPEGIFYNEVLKDFIASINGYKDIKRVKPQALSETKFEKLRTIYCNDVNDEFAVFLEKSNLVYSYTSLKEEEAVGHIVSPTVFEIYHECIVKYLLQYSTDLITLHTNSSGRFLIENTNVDQNRRSAVSLIFDNVLPIPTSDVSVKKLLKFKRKRKQELLQLRMSIDNVKKEIQKAETEKTIKEILISNREKIDIALIDIRKASKSDGVSTTTNFIKNVLDFDKPNLINTITSAGLVSAGVDSKMALSLGLIGLSLGTVSLFMRKKTNHDYAYIYEATKKGII